jgi:hypothetical protein
MHNVTYAREGAPMWRACELGEQPWDRETPFCAEPCSGCLVMAAMELNIRSVTPFLTTAEPCPSSVRLCSTDESHFHKTDWVRLCPTKASHGIQIWTEI